MAGEGSVIWIYDNGQTSQTFTARGPNGYVTGNTITVNQEAEYIEFALTTYSAYVAVAALATMAPISANGKTLHVKFQARTVDSRARAIYVFAYASQTITDTTNVPDSISAVDQFYPNGNGDYYTVTGSVGTHDGELVIPITQPNTYIAFGVLKRFEFVQYVRITQIWIE